MGIASAWAQMGAASGTSQPWLAMKLDKTKKIKLEFSSASVDLVLRLMAKSSGVPIMKDPALTGTITISTVKAVSLADAFAMLSAVLDLKGFEMQGRGTFLVIKQRPRTNTNRFFGGSGAGTGLTGGSIASGDSGSGTTRVTTELQMYALQYASASAVAKTINDVFGQSTNSSGFSFQGFGGGGDSGGPGGGGPGGGGPGGGGPGGGGPGGGPLTIAAAQGGPGGGGPGGFGMFGGRSGSSSSSSQNTVKASYDDYTNSVIVNATHQMQLQVAALIKQIDKETKQPITTEMYTLVYASASDLVTPIQNVLTANAPKGRGGTSTSSSQSSGFTFGSSRSSTSSASVSADTRSNSLLVTTTDANQVLVSKLIAKLDKEIPYKNATAVVPLANAKASDIASILNQAFNGKTSTSTTTTKTSSSSSSNSLSNNSRSNSNGLSLTGEAGTSADAGNYFVQMEDPMAEAGPLATTVAVQQGGFGFGQTSGGGSSGSSSSSSSSSTIYRDAQGRVINIATLTNKVTIVADPSTNSLVIVGEPAAVAAIQEVLEKLDKVPEQVLIETAIVEATLDSTKSFGVEWTISQNKALGYSGLTNKIASSFGLSTSSNGFQYTLSGSDLSAFMTALQTDMHYKVLSTPRIFTTNNNEATINISQAVPYVTSQTEDSNGNYTYNYSTEDVGIVLDVTPQISPSGIVTLDVTQTANDLEGYTSFNAPIVNQRETETVVSVQDGQTVVLGGIMQNTVTATTNKIPLLGDLPLLGNLFKSTKKEDQKTELLVFLTPHIVHNSADAKKVTDDTRSQMGKDLQKEVPGGKQ
jgi:general secretion pathway protein D